MYKLYYISQGDSPHAQLKNIENVCKANVKMIQFRMKNATDDVFLQTALKAAEITSEYEAKFIVNDKIHLCQNINTDGFHLGKNDIPIEEAKKVACNKIIGGTANTLDDCIKLIENKVDYIGLGPFSFTTTKKNLSPILRLEGYKNILKETKKYSTPIYAIGGIKINDIPKLLDAGVYGIAVSSLLSNKSIVEIKKITNQFNQMVNQVV